MDVGAEVGSSNHASKVPAVELRCILESIPLKLSSRPYVQGLSACFGASSSGGRSPAPLIASGTMANADAIRNLNKALQRMECFPKGFAFTSLQLGRNQLVDPHTDRNNLGPSLAFSCGSFRGGDLVVDGRKYVTKDKCVPFDGRLEHYVEPFSPSDRSSLIAFTHSLWEQLEAKDIAILKDLSFPLPVAVGSRKRPLLRSAAEASSEKGRRILIQGPPSMDLKPKLKDHLCSSNEAVSAALATCRRCIYRGPSHLPVLPWKSKFLGNWLVIDLFAGVSGLLATLAALDVSFRALVVEEDLNLLESQLVNFPDAVLTRSVESLEGWIVKEVCNKRELAGIIVGGGAPCQPNSTQNSESEGLSDRRAPLPEHIVRLCSEIMKVVSDLPVLSFLEAPSAGKNSAVRIVLISQLRSRLKRDASASRSEHDFITAWARWVAWRKFRRKSSLHPSLLVFGTWVINVPK